MPLTDLPTDDALAFLLSIYGERETTVRRIVALAEGETSGIEQRLGAILRG